jgi:hypothetical protein
MKGQATNELRRPLARLLGMPVVDDAGVRLGVVVGRILSGTGVDLLVQRRRLFHRSRYLRLRGDGINISGQTFVYRPPAEPTAMPAVIRLTDRRSRSSGDAA